MTKLIVKPESLYDAWQLYSNYLESTNPKILAVAKTALFRYTLPGYGLPIEAQKLDAWSFMKKVPIHLFVDALNVQQKVFDFLNTNKHLQQTNRHRLKQMLDWCSSQDWWVLATHTESRQYAPRRRNQLGNAHKVRLVNRKGGKPYRLKIDEISLSLQAELDELWKFQTSIQVRYRQDNKVRKPTAEKTRMVLLLVLGWLHREQNVALEELSFKQLDDIDVAYNYTAWLREERHASPKTELQALVALLNAAKFLHYKESNQKLCKQLTKTYVDIPIINELRELVRLTNERVKESSIVADESQKWLDWPEFLACVDYLKKDCAIYTSDGQLRTERTIARSYERYLIAALLAYMPPDRQRTLRELEVGKTLVRGTVKNDIFCPKADGQWYIKLGSEDYKTGKAYKEQTLEVPENIYPELEAWLNQWRAVLKPTHNFVFCQLNGKPYTRESLYHLFRHAIYRASVVLFGEGKALNPHLVRDMAVTYFIRVGASEHQMDALAIGMKHSRRTQREIYDRRTKQEKVAPAQQMMLSVKPVELPLPKLESVSLSPVDFLPET
jgi:hypothetical protein